MSLPLTIEYRMGGQSKWETLHLRIKTDDGFTIEYHEKDSHNADVRFESETYEKAKKYLYDALLNYPHFYRVEEKAEHLEYNKQQLIIADVSQQRELLIAYEKFTSKEAYNDLEQPINNLINKFLAINCG